MSKFASLDRAIIAGVGSGPETSAPFALELVESIKEATPTLREAPVSGVPAIDKGKGAFVLAL